MRGSSKSIAVGGVLASLLLSGVAAEASVIDLVFTSTIGFAASNSSISGTAVNDIVTINVFADNGGSSLANQTWTSTVGNSQDIKNITLSISDPTTHSALYSASYSTVWQWGASTFTTDASGNIVSAHFAGVDYSSTNTDSSSSKSWVGRPLTGAGVIYDHTNVKFDDITGWNASSDPSYSVFNNVANWSIAPAPTPLPAALPLFATGAGLAGLLGWRRRRTVQAA